MKKKATLTRQLILEILLEVSKGEFLHIVQKAVLDKYDYLEDKDRTFIKRLSSGCVERMLTLDYIIDQFSKTPVKKCKIVIAWILRMAVYQMYFMDSVPDSATVNEAVNLCCDKGFYNLKGFVNGVLRNISRSEKISDYPDLSVKYSIPEEVIGILKDYLKSDEVIETMLLKSLEAPNLTVRVNTSKITVEACIQLLKEDGVLVNYAPYFDNALIIKTHKGLECLEVFRKGFITVMDISSMFVASIIEPKAYMKVLDLCSAPGGKTYHVADMMGDAGKIISCDISDYKVSLIKEGANRQGFNCINPIIRDALSDEADFLEEEFDVIIADLPCSGLGVMGRKADIKYRIQTKDIESLAKLQKDILKNNIKYLKKGGLLLFSTCTVSACENYENYKFIKDEMGLTPVPFDKKLPKDLISDSAKDGYLQLIPGIHKCDGFFVSLFMKE